MKVEKTAMKKSDDAKKVVSSEEIKLKLKQAAIPDSITFAGS